MLNSGLSRTGSEVNGENDLVGLHRIGFLPDEALVEAYLGKTFVTYGCAALFKRASD